MEKFPESLVVRMAVIVIKCSYPSSWSLGNSKATGKCTSLLCYPWKITDERQAVRSSRKHDKSRLSQPYSDLWGNYGAGHIGMHFWTSGEKELPESIFLPRWNFCFAYWTAPEFLCQCIQEAIICKHCINYECSSYPEVRGRRYL